jgi:hypothetical protein
MSDLDRRYPKARVAGVPGDLERGRRYYEQRAWANAYQSLALADQAAPWEPRISNC